MRRRRQGVELECGRRCGTEFRYKHPTKRNAWAGCVVGVCLLTLLLPKKGLSIFKLPSIDRKMVINSYSNNMRTTWRAFQSHVMNYIYTGKSTCKYNSSKRYLHMLTMSTYTSRSRYMFGVPSNIFTIIVRTLQNSITSTCSNRITHPLRSIIHTPAQQNHPPVAAAFHHRSIIINNE